MTNTTVVVRSNLNQMDGKFLPATKVIMHTRLGDNLISKSEFCYPSAKGVTYLGYAHSSKLHFGLALQQLDPHSKGFMEKPFNLGFELHYRD